MEAPLKFFGIGRHVEVIEVEPMPFVVFPIYIPPSTMEHRKRHGDAWNAFRWNPKYSRYEYFNTLFPDDFEASIKKWHNATMDNVFIGEWPVVPEMRVVFKNAIPTAASILKKEE